MKGFLLHKLTLRVSYIVAAYCTSQAVSLLSQPEVQQLLNNAGVGIQVHDAAKLKTIIAGAVLIAGEFLYELFHKKVVLPQVAPKAEIQDTPATK